MNRFAYTYPSNVINISKNKVHCHFKIFKLFTNIDTKSHFSKHYHLDTYCNNMNRLKSKKEKKGT